MVVTAGGVQGGSTVAINFLGRLVDERRIRSGFIGCGSHSFRNVYPALQFVPVDLVAVCDLDIDRAKAFARQFGAVNAYSDYKEMLQKENLEAVFIVVGYDATGRPLYPKITVDCLNAGCHVWIEKPPAASCEEIEIMQEASVRNGKNVVVGVKKMFFPANEKAWELSHSEDFGQISLVLMQYPQYIPTADDFDRFLNKGEKVQSVTSFLDHLCHPASLMIFLLGYPSTLYYDRTASGAGVLTFTFDTGAVASLALTFGASGNGGMERTTIISNKGKHIVVDNNVRVSYHQTPPGHRYGCTPSFFTGSTNETTAVWEPEFSLGQLYNKGLFLLGYYGEIAEFACSILENRSPAKGTLEQAWHITRIFERFAEGPRKLIDL
jgi:predicted dehydrogenase